MLSDFSTLMFLLLIATLIYLFLSQSVLKTQVNQLQKTVRSLSERLNLLEYSERERGELHHSTPEVLHNELIVPSSQASLEKVPPSQQSPQAAAQAPLTTTVTRQSAPPAKHKTLSHHNSNRASTSTRQAVSKQPSVFSTWLERGMRTAKQWLTTGNVPVKIGVLVLLATVIAFLRFATQQGWLSVPIEVKLGGIAVAALAALGFAWKQREHKRSFSLSVQGGSLGVLLLELFAATKLFQLMPAAPAFALSVVVVAAAAWLAVKQDAKPLAIFAILAGFLAPIWLSDGSGSHVVLFSYYAILNSGIFYMATQKPWRELNLLGFVATYVIGAVWGGLQYRAADFATTLPFVLLFFVLYLLIPFYYQALPRAEEKTHQRASTRRIDSALLFGTPLVTVASLAAMLYERSNVLAAWCFALGVVYALLAWVLRTRDSATWQTLQTAYWGLAAGLMTLAVPIGLSAKATGTIFALEGAGAVWLGLRQGRTLTQWVGIALQGLAAVAFGVAYHAVSDFERAIVNDYYPSTVLITAAGGISAWFFMRSIHTKQASNSDFPAVGLASGLFVWALVWWLGAGLHEIVRYAALDEQLSFSLIGLLGSSAAVAYVWRYLRLPVVAQAAALGLLLTVLFALHRLAVVFEVPMSADTLGETSVVAWATVAIFGALTLRWLRPALLALTPTAVVAWLLALLLAATSMLGQWLGDYPRSSTVYWLVISSLWLGGAYLLQWRPQWLIRCYPPQANRWLLHLCQLMTLVLFGLFLRLLGISGGEEFYLPVLSMVDALQIALLIPLLVYVIQQERNNGKPQRRAETVFYYALIWLTLGAITWRIAHHWGGVSWTLQIVVEFVYNITVYGDIYNWLLYGLWLVLGTVLLRDVPALTRRFANWQPLRLALFDGIMLIVGFGWYYNLSQAGNAAPLPWIPVLNPLELWQIAVLALAWYWAGLRGVPEKIRALAMLAAALVLVSVITLRFVHQVAEVPWSLTMISDSAAQMALTVVWSILGVICWLLGSKRGSRLVWLLGAALMSVVLLKLIAVDRAHLGNVFGILSFFAYGLLCVVVGYFAPAPPAAVLEGEA